MVAKTARRAVVTEADARQAGVTGVASGAVVPEIGAETEAAIGGPAVTGARKARRRSISTS